MCVLWRPSGNWTKDVGMVSVLQKPIAQPHKKTNQNFLENQQIRPVETVKKNFVGFFL